MNDNVVGDYRNMIEISEKYEQDAILFNEISKDLGASSKEMSADMSGINEKIKSIAEMIDGIADFMKNIGDAATDSENSTESVLAKMEELSKLSEELNNTVAAFKA